jgi:hypothetical protein
MAISEQERKRRSELAKKLVAEGRIGGNRGGGRPKKKTATDIVAEKIADEADSIYQALQDGIDPMKEKSATRRAQNAQRMLQFEMEAEREKRAEQKDLGEMKKNEIIDGLVEMLNKFRGLPEFGAMFADTEITEANIIEEPQGLLEA